VQLTHIPMLSSKDNLGREENKGEVE